jgi:hypothetical protein
MKNNKGGALVPIIIIVFLVAVPYFFRNTSTTTDPILNNANDSGDEGASWFGIFTPTESVNYIPQSKEDDPVEEKKDVVPRVVNPNQSSLHNKISISYINERENDPRYEYITIENVTESEKINITGIRIETSGNEYFKIPEGYELPGMPYSVKKNIVLAPGGSATIYVGHQENMMNFQENICTGYFNETYNFGNILSRRCPVIDVSKMLNFSDSCIDALKQINRCEKFDTTTILPANCHQFATEHYSYAGCVKDYQKNEDFYLGNWFVWMQRGIEFFRNTHDKVILKDTLGKIIDEYEY